MKGKRLVITIGSDAHVCTVSWFGMSREGLLDAMDAFKQVIQGNLTIPHEVTGTRTRMKATVDYVDPRHVLEVDLGDSGFDE
jgi:hypothetical protein